MVPKRVKQFYKNVVDKMNKSDIKYVESILTKDEQALFFKLQNSEQKHCVRIAKDIERTIDENLISNKKLIMKRNIFVRIALLHDVGKANKKLNVIDKSIIVILNKTTKGKLKEFKFSKKIQCYYNHGDYSYEKLKNMEKDDDLLYIIKNHHKNIDDEYVKFFQMVDDRN